MSNEKTLPYSVIPAQEVQVVILSEEIGSDIRKQFISKVYSIVWLQILFTSIFIGLCNQIEPLAKFMISQTGLSISYICMTSLFVMIVMLLCNDGLIKYPPHNWIYLIIFTTLMTYMVGIIGIVSSTQSLLLGGISTLTIFSGLTLYAWQTKYDYTTMGNCLLVCLLGLIVMGFMMWFINSSFIRLLYSVGGAVLFSFYIIYDTQLIIGGKHRKIMFSIDDYVLAAISLYLDIINLFLFIMDIINGRGDC